jgi:hypothetical protein
LSVEDRAVLRDTLSREFFPANAAEKNGLIFYSQTSPLVSGPLSVGQAPARQSTILTPWTTDNGPLTGDIAAKNAESWGSPGWGRTPIFQPVTSSLKREEA